MSIFESLAQLPEQALAQAFGVGVGLAIAEALRPLAVTEAQAAWTIDPIKAPDAGTLAAGVSQGQVDLGKAKAWAAESGIGSDAFAALVDIANTGPALGAAYQAWRRGELSDGEFVTALNRTGLEPQWYDAMKALKDNLLEPGEIAKAIHRGIMKADGLLIASPPSTPGNVPSIPPSSIDPVTEAAGSGFDSERLRIMVGNAGLPLGLHEMLNLLNRGAMTSSDVQRGIAESNLRNEYQDVALLLARQLLTAHDYVEAQIRGYIDEDARRAGTRLHGMTDADSDLLFLNSGRPLVAHAITTGLARGGVFHPLPGELTDPYDAAVHESSVHPSYYDLWKANRYTIPSYFILKAILADGGITQAEFADYGKQLGWPPDLAEKAAAALAGGGTATADPNVVKAQNQLWAATHSSYVDHNTDEAGAKERFTLIGIAPAVQDKVLALWNSERDLVRASLTATQISKAVGEPGRDVAWATGRLQELGWDAEDAGIFLAE